LFEERAQEEVLDLLVSADQEERVDVGKVCLGETAVEEDSASRRHLA
jgi:hypothetical protein